MLEHRPDHLGDRDVARCQEQHPQLLFLGVCAELGLSGSASFERQVLELLLDVSVSWAQRGSSRGWVELLLDVSVSWAQHGSSRSWVTSASQWRLAAPTRDRRTENQKQQACRLLGELQPIGPTPWRARRPSLPPGLSPSRVPEPAGAVSTMVVLHGTRVLLPGTRVWCSTRVLLPPGYCHPGFPRAGCLKWLAFAGVSALRVLPHASCITILLRAL